MSGYVVVAIHLGLVLAVYGAWRLFGWWMDWRMIKSMVRVMTEHIRDMHKAGFEPEPFGDVLRGIVERRGKQWTKRDEWIVEQVEKATGECNSLSPEKG